MLLSQVLGCLLLIALSGAAAAKPEVDDETTRTERKRFLENLPGRSIILYPVNIAADTLDCVKASVGVGLGRGRDLEGRGSVRDDNPEADVRPHAVPHRLREPGRRLLLQIAVPFS